MPNDAYETLQNTRDDVAKILRETTGKPIESKEEIYASMTVEQRQMDGLLDILSQIANSLDFMSDKIDNIDNKYMG